MSKEVKNDFEELTASIDSDCMAFMKKEIQPLEELLKNIDQWFEKANVAASQIKKKGYSDIDLTWNGSSETSDAENSNDKNYSVEKLPLQEKSLNIPEETLKSERPRRTASKAASQSINKQLNSASSSKKSVYVKKEKLSTWCEEESVSDSTFTPPPDNVKIKEEEIITEMPAPTRPAPKSRKPKQTSLKIKKEKLIVHEQEVQKRVTRSKKVSDVIIQEVKQEPIEISDSDEETIVPVQKKRARPFNEDEDEEISVENRDQKRSKSGSGNEEDTSAAPAKDNTANTTFCPQSTDETFCVKPTDTTFVSHSTMNATVVIEKPTIKPQVPEDLMTDDESEEESRKSPIKPVKKQIFSAFEQSPVKKKVEAFEKLHEQATLPRVTRTKTRALAKEQDEAGSSEATESAVKEKVKLFTPKISKFTPKACSTQTSKRTVSNSTLDSSKSALKASQVEFRERERLRKEKEESLKKREALLQSQMEERKRKREERQLNAQKQRELLEMEKQKALEAQRLKEERNHRLLAEQEERKQKLREENEKKRVMAKMRAAEEKRKEEERRLQEQKKIKELNANLAKNHEEMMKTAEKQKLLRQQQTTVPVYMKSKAPLLPTEDCYDSDDEEHAGENSYVAEWAKPEALKEQQLLMLAVGEKIKNTFFSIQAQTPDLQEIFEVIAPTKLKRSSSACWQKPPRFTMLPPSLDFHQEDSDDESE